MSVCADFTFWLSSPCHGSSYLHTNEDPDVDAAWRQETRRRLAELESGKVQAIPGDVVSADIRKIVGR